MWSSKQLKQLTLDKNYLYNARQTCFFSHHRHFGVPLFPEAATVKVTGLVKRAKFRQL